LKKKRTKNSNHSREVNSPTSGLTETTTAPAVSQTHTSEEPHAISDYRSSGNNPPSAESAITSDSSRPMNAVPSQHTPSQSHPSSQPSSHPSPQKHQNVTSINNIINPPQHAEGGNAVQYQHAEGVAHQQPVQPQQRQLKGKYSLEDFALRRTLGTGSFGRVHLVQSNHNQRYYAMKVLKKEQVVKMKQIEHTNDERRMLQRVKHPFLITLWGTFQDAKNLYMVMDFVEGGELFSLLRKSQVSSKPRFTSHYYQGTTNHVRFNC
jgi:protein kinase A